MPVITPHFAVPMATAQIDQADEINARLREIFLAREAEGATWANKDAYKVSSKALFESNFRLFETDDPTITRLRSFCWKQLYQLIGEVNGYDVATLRRLHSASEAWFHITRKGGSFAVHNHPMHSWSGVYCVCQEGDDADPESGRFNVINPNAMTNMYMDMAAFRLMPPYSRKHLSLRLQPGQLLLFPSWLLHYVSPFEPTSADGLRITVAFNARFRLDGYQQGDRL